jgi:hypothetical protein
MTTQKNPVRREQSFLRTSLKKKAINTFKISAILLLNILTPIKTT